MNSDHVNVLGLLFDSHLNQLKVSGVCSTSVPTQGNANQLLITLSSLSIFILDIVNGVQPCISTNIYAQIHHGYMLSCKDQYSN